jgi:DNA-binding beta-propeller fold protein YncE
LGQYDTEQILPASSIATIDASSNTLAGRTQLGGDTVSLTNTPAAIAVTQDRSDVYVSIPRTSSVAVISTSATSVRLMIPVAASPAGLAMKPDLSVTLTPYLIDAVDDTPPRFHRRVGSRQTSWQ